MIAWALRSTIMETEKERKMRDQLAHSIESKLSLADGL